MGHRALLLIIIGMLALASASLAGVCGDPDAIATPAAGVTASELVATATPADTATPAATVAHSFGFDETAVLPSPRSDDEPMLIGGVLWIDGTTPTGEVVAYLGDNECGRGQAVLSGDGGYPDFLVTVASDSQQPGCGVPGAPVTLTLNGRAMDETTPWRPGMQQPRTFFAGDVVAQYVGTVRFDAPFDVSGIVPQQVVPYIDGVVCGAQVNPMQGNGQIVYQVVVSPASLQQGCGRAGSQVELRLVGMAEGGPFDIVIAHVPWQPGPFVQVTDVDLVGATIGVEPTVTRQ